MTVSPRRLGAGVIALAGLLLTTGCAGSPERDDVSRVARAFVQAVQAKDGSAACDLLTSDAQDAAVGATDATCEDTVVGIDESGADITGVQVWQDKAQVRIGSDVLFLNDLAAGWRVRAAGCTFDSARHGYQCEIDG